MRDTRAPAPRRPLEKLSHDAARHPFAPSFSQQLIDSPVTHEPVKRHLSAHRLASRAFGLAPPIGPRSTSTPLG
jgi:hypothetical protein